MQNTVTQVFWKQENQEWRWGQESALCSPVSWSRSLNRQLVWCVCANKPGYPSTFRIHMHTCTQTRLLCPMADGTLVLKGRCTGSTSHLCMRNAEAEISTKGISGADGLAWSPQCSRQSTVRALCRGRLRIQGLRTWAPALLPALSASLDGDLSRLRCLLLHVLSEAFPF